MRSSTRMRGSRLHHSLVARVHSSALRANPLRCNVSLAFDCSCGARARWKNVSSPLALAMSSVPPVESLTTFGRFDVAIYSPRYTYHGTSFSPLIVWIGSMFGNGQASMATRAWGFSSRFSVAMNFGYAFCMRNATTTSASEKCFVKKFPNRSETFLYRTGCRSFIIAPMNNGRSETS